MAREAPHARPDITSGFVGWTFWNHCEKKINFSSSCNLETKSEHCKKVLEGRNILLLGWEQTEEGDLKKENTSEAHEERKQYIHYEGGGYVICPGPQTSHTSLNLTLPLPPVAGTPGLLARHFLIAQHFTVVFVSSPF